MIKLHIFENPKVNAHIQSYLFQKICGNLFEIYRKNTYKDSQGARNLALYLLNNIDTLKNIRLGSGDKDSSNLWFDHQNNMQTELDIENIESVRKQLIQITEGK